MTKQPTACNHPVQLSWWELWPMLGWGFFVVYLYAKGRMALFLHPVYGHMAAAGGLLLLALFAYGWLLRRRSIKRRAAAPQDAGASGHAADCAGGQTSAWRVVRSLAFLVPLAIGFALPERGLNAFAAGQRGVTNWAVLAELAAQRQEEKAQWKRGYAWTTVLGLAQRLKGGPPEKVGAMGFVFRDAKLAPDEFLLVRFMITCCAADAQPMAVLVRWKGTDPAAAQLHDNQWVEVYGSTDPAAKCVVADDVVPIREPARPYM
jgi:putative membrane protein